MKIAFYCRVDGQGFGFVHPKKLTSSASFSPSIRISLRLKIHQAQAKNFCRVLDIRVAKIMKPHLRHPVFCYVLRKVLRQIVRAHALSQFIHKDITVVLVVIAIAANLLVVTSKNSPHHIEKIAKCCIIKANEVRR